MAPIYYANPWMYENKPYHGSDFKQYAGFVYIIENLKTGHKYIGKKTFWAKRRDRKTRRRKIVESSWRYYWGSSEQLKKDIEIYGKKNFSRRILRLCKTKKEMSYWELKEQVVRDVLVDESYYNSNILGKFWKRDVGVHADT